MPPWCRPSWTTWSAEVSTRRSAASSSSMEPRRCPRRSARPSAATPRSSAARFTRLATSPSASPSPCMPACARRCVRRQLDDAEKAEKLIGNLARRLEREAPGVSASILEGIDEILTVTRLGLPVELRRSLACTNIIENMNGTIRQVCRNVKRWRDATMALRWTAAGMMEAAKGFRRLKAHRQLPILRAALAAHQAKHAINPDLEQQAKAA